MDNEKVVFVLKAESVVFFLDGQPHNIAKTNSVLYSKTINAIKDNDVERLRELIKPASQVVANSVSASCNSTKVNVVDGILYIDGEEAHSSIANKIYDMYVLGFDLKPVVKFIENLLQNPSNSSVKELYDFMLHNDIPITEDGCFIVYKLVQNDFYSITAGKIKLIRGKVNEKGQIFNGIGEVIECERNAVDDDRRRDCSHGLHVGAYKYAGPNGNFANMNSGSNRTVIVKVNPKDVVSVPLDYDVTKMRVCQYEVMSEFKCELTDKVYTSSCEESVTYNSNLTIDDVIEGDYLVFEYHDDYRGVKVERVHDNYLSCLCIDTDSDDYGLVKNYSKSKIQELVVFKSEEKALEYLYDEE